MPLSISCVRNAFGSLKRAFALAAFLAGLTAGPAAQAQTTWNNTAGGFSWSTAGNWSAGIPSIGVAATFGDTGFGTLTLDGDQSALGLTFSNAAASPYIINVGSGGSLTVGTSGITSSTAGAVTINAPITLSGIQTWTRTNTSGSLTIGGNIFLSSASATANTLTLTGAGSFNLTGVIANFNGGAGTASGLSFTGTGTLTLSGSNTFTGDVASTTTGTIVVTNANALGAGTGLLSLANGVVHKVNLRIDGAGSNSTIIIPKSISASSNGTNTFDVGNNGGGNTGNQIQFAGAGTNSFGNATYNITGSNGYSLYFSQVRLTAGSTGTLTLNPTTAALSIGAVGSGVNRAQTVAFSGTNTGNSVTGAITTALGTGSGTSTVVNITKIGTSTWTFQGNNTYTGTTTVSAGTLIVTGSMGNTPITITGGTLQFGDGTTGHDANLGSTAGIANAGALVFNRFGTTTLTQAITGAGTVTKSGAGTQVLSGANNYTGLTTVTAGTLQIGAQSTLGNVTVADAGAFGVKVNSLTQTVSGGSANAGTLTYGTTGGSTLAVDFGNLGNPTVPLYNISAGTLTLNGNVATTFSNASTLTNGVITLIDYNTLAGTGSFTQPLSLGTRTSGVVSIDTVNTAVILTVTSDRPKWTGSDSSSWQVGTTGALGNWKLLASGSPTDYIEGDNVLFDDSATSASVAINVADVNPIAVTFANTSARTYTLSGTKAIAGTTGVALTGTGTVILTNANTYIGATTIGTGATLQLGDGTSGNDGSVAGTSGVTNSGTLNYSPFGIVSSNRIISGAGTVVKAGPGTQTLAGLNTYTGATLINAGILQVGIAQSGTTGALGNNSAVTLADVAGAALDLNSFATSIGSLAGGGVNGGNVTLGTATLTLGGNNANATYGGIISGTGAVTKVGTGTQTFNGPNTYTGTTTLTAGTLILGGSSSATNTININGTGATLIVTNAGATGTGGIRIVTGATTSNIQFRIDGGGTISLPNFLGGNSALTASIDVNNNGTGSNGIIQLTGSGSIGNSTFNITGGNGYSLSLANLTDNAGGGGTLLFNPTTAALSIGSFTASTNQAHILGLGGSNANNAVTGIISNGASTTAGVGVTKSGTSTWTLSGANTYTAATTINGGTLVLANGGNLGSTNVTVNAGTFGIRHSASGETTAAGNALSMAAGTAFTMADGFTGTANVSGAAVLSGASGSASSLTFDFDTASTSSDVLAIAGGASFGIANAVINVNALGNTAPAPGGNTYTILTAAFGLSANTFVLGSNRVVINNVAYSLSLTGTDSTQSIVVGAVSSPVTFYWVGDVGGSWSSSTSGNTNFASDPAGTTDTGSLPVNGFNDVVFSATNASTVANLTLDNSFTINSMSYLAGSRGYTLASGVGANVLTINSGGILNASLNPQTITADIALGASQTWSNTGSALFSIQGAVNLGGNTLTVGGTGASEITGIVTGAGGLAKTGTGTLTLSNANTYTGSTAVSAGTMVVPATGSITSSATTQIFVADGTSNALLIVNGGSVQALKSTAPSLSIGSGGGAGSLVINNGIVTTASELWVSTVANGYGNLTVNGGSLTTGSWLALGRSGGHGDLRVTNGSVTVSTNHLTIGSIAGTANQGIATLSGTAAVAITAGGVYVGELSTGTLTLSGSATLTTGSAVGITMANAAGATGIFNLNGGTVTAAIVAKGNASGTAILNFNGGTLRPTAASTTFLTGLTTANVYSGGALIDTQAFNITVGQSLSAPAGNGVSATGLTVSGSGFLAPPSVDITGGGGVGATAITTIDANGNITGITITNPGTGYTSPPTFTFVGGGSTVTQGGAASLVANTSGGLTKLGSGTLTLSGTNTYTGVTAVSAGMLEFFTTTSMPNYPTPVAGRITVASGTMLGLGFGSAGQFTSTDVTNIGNGTLPVTFPATATLALDTTTASATYTGGLANPPGTTSLALVKVGANTLTVSGTSTYTGGTVIAGGVLQANSDAALGSGTVSFTSTGVRLAIGSGVNLANPIIIGANAGAVGNGLIQAVAGTGTVSGPITINSSATAGGHFAGNGGTLVVSGVITSLVQVAQRLGTVVYSGGGTGYTDMIVTGTTIVGANNGIATTALLRFGGSGDATLDLAGFNQSLAGIVRSANVATIANSSTTADSTIAITGTSTFSGTIVNTTGAGTRTVALAVNGGSLTLTAANTYSGPTTITNGGTLTLGASGTIANSATINAAAGATFDVTAQAAFALAAGQTLTGGGTVNGGVNAATGSTLKPGSPTGSTGLTMTANAGAGAVNISDGSSLSLRVLGTPSAGTAGSSTNDPTLTAQTTNTALRLTTGNLTGLSSTSAITIVIDGTSATLADGTAYSFLIAQGNATQDFSALNLTSTANAVPGTATFTANGFTADPNSFSLTGSNTGAVYLNFTTVAVPEPGTILGLAAGLGLVGWIRRRR